MKTYVCQKCGEELILDDLSTWGKRACPGCDEPIPQDVIRARVEDDMIDRQMEREG